MCVFLCVFVKKSSFEFSVGISSMFGGLTWVDASKFGLKSRIGKWMAGVMGRNHKKEGIVKSVSLQI